MSGLSDEVRQALLLFHWDTCTLGACLCGVNRRIAVVEDLIAQERARGAAAVVERVEAVLDGPTISAADRKRLRAALLASCHCPPCPGRGNDGHGLTHCAECCFGSGVEADPDCLKHGRAALRGPS